MHLKCFRSCSKLADNKIRNFDLRKTRVTSAWRSVTLITGGWKWVKRSWRCEKRNAIFSDSAWWLGARHPVTPCRLNGGALIGRKKYFSRADCDLVATHWKSVLTYLEWPHTCIFRINLLTQKLIVSRFSLSTSFLALCCSLITALFMT